MTSTDLSDIYALFGQGLLIGGFLSAFPFLIGYVVNYFFSLLRKA